MSNNIHPLLKEALEAHGGYDRWRSFTGIASTIRTGGKLWELKGAPLIPVPRRATSEFRRQWTRVAPFGEPDWTMIWTPGHVKISAGDGSLIAERDNGRDAFDRSFHGQWDPLNLAYFNGYAMWTYHATPFVLADPGYEARDIAPIEDAGERLRGVAVRFPKDVHSHTREQCFYFSSNGLLRRHDYTVDVWADSPAAHFTTNYVDVDGLKYPTQRSVFTLKPNGTLDRDFNAVTIDMSEYELF
ncbi:hypothetical protein MRS76_22275 [Rhizobiaceae bacterium n13]|uniref:Uncharacterized protein n=1 Tax=Ferirhizobium litorale TaxID=2927786 RepID=A0AAE3U3A6_9HYPH|nr:hypothetical protein [Fererhizobium litorale]MDI7864662.1 hypothetical protein [Fererhizobium litorale]MDI7922153.1 hypothetical protein [Fererhizobium litorale]